MLKQMILQKVKDHNRALSSDDAYYELICYVFSKIQQWFQMSKSSVMKG